MNETKIIRTVDDLGRIVIPYDIRKQLGIECGNDMEITVNRLDDGKIVICLAKVEGEE